MMIEWQLTKLGEVCKVIAGQSPEGKFYNEAGEGIPFYQGKKEFQEKYIGAPRIWTREVTKEAEAGDVLMSVRAPVGPVNFATEKICIGRGLAAIRASHRLDRDFLFYFLLSKQAEISGNEGAVFASINKAQIEEIQLPLFPFPEQKRIVAILDEALAGIDTAAASAEKNLVNARELFDSYLNSIFTQKGEGWVRKKLEDTVEKTCSLSYGIVQPGEDVNGGLPIVRPTDLQSKIIYLNGLKRIDPALADGYRRTKLYGGELLLCVRGGTGSISVAANELAGSNVTRGIVPIRFDPAVLIQEFGYFAFSSKGLQDQIRAATYGAALMQINIRDLRKVFLDLPPLDVQGNLLEKLANISAEVERLASIYEQKAAALAGLKQAILQKAFAGELAAQPEKPVQEAAE